jgi:hypothetical protein
MAVLPNDFLGSVLEGLEPRNEDVCQKQKATRSGTVFIGPSEDFLGYHFAEEGPGEVDGLVMGGERLLSDELGSVDEKAIHWKV